MLKWALGDPFTHRPVFLPLQLHRRRGACQIFLLLAVIEHRFPGRPVNSLVFHSDAAV